MYDFYGFKSGHCYVKLNLLVMVSQSWAINGWFGSRVHDGPDIRRFLKTKIVKIIQNTIF